MSDETQPNNLSRLIVVIVNYRTPDLTIDCLRSLVSEVRSLPGTRVVVSDNDSGNGSVEKKGTAIETENKSNWVSQKPKKHNGGFAFGNNAVIRPILQSTN